MGHNLELEQAVNEIEKQKLADGVITLVLTADNHLGYATPALPPRKRELRKQQLRHAFQQATDFAIGQGVDFFVQAGDLFDVINPEEQDRSFVAERLAQLGHAGIKTLAVGGIHDTSSEPSTSLDGAKIDYSSFTSAPQLSYARLGALHYFTRSFEGAMDANFVQTQENKQLEPVVFDVRSMRVGICGVSVAVGQEGDPLEYLRKPDALDDVAIALLVLHAPIEGFASVSSSNDIRAQVNRASIANQSIFRHIQAIIIHTGMFQLAKATLLLQALHNTSTSMNLMTSQVLSF
jgi:DNA repair protein SbcD/Mre11